ncbi:MAG: hypothetical protein DHS20C15_05200 [Planctomycetota bacterium]|nr:MAG: hypothetical protein DHS20C15_05200 [Planctomycetota bacterium]
MALSGVSHAQLAARGVGAEIFPQPAEQVLAETRWRFAADSSVRGERPGHVAHGERCLRPLLSRLRDVAPQLDEDARTELSALSPLVELSLRNGLRVSGDAVLRAQAEASAAAVSGEGGSQLPLMPELELSMEGKECIVHYTLTGEHASPDASYVKTIAKSVDKAAKKLTKAFRRPFYEPAEDGIDKLHVFVLSLDLDPDLGDALAAVSDVQDAPGMPGGKAQTVYMSFDTGLREYASSVGDNWKKVIAGTAMHEYMHCVQSAYSAFFSRWAVEGQATWAELAFGKYKEGVKGYLAGPMSIMNAPELPIWHDSIHQYSTAPMFFYLDFFNGKGSNKTFLELSPDTNDGLDIFEQVLFQTDFNFFSDFYPPYLARLYQKSIKGIPKSAIPDFDVSETGIKDYGWKATGSVLPTAVQVFEFEAPPSQKTDYLFVSVRPGSGDEGGDARPEGVLLHAKNKRLSFGSFGWSDIDKFRGKAKAALIVTDWDYEFPTETPTPFEAEVFVPFLDINSVSSNSPVPQAGDVEVTFNYDLLGTPAGLEQFSVLLFHTIKSPKKPLQQQFLARVWEVGTNKEHVEQFSLATPGTHKLHYTARTPNDSYTGEHVRDKANLKVKVLKP